MYCIKTFLDDEAEEVSTDESEDTAEEESEDVEDNTSVNGLRA